MDLFRKLRMAPIRNFRRLGGPRLRRTQRLATAVESAGCGPSVEAVLIETPAHINRLAWAWLREFQQDLQDDCDNRLEANQ
jgi:hypothetical protein